MTQLPASPQGIGPVLDSGFRLYGASLKHVILLSGLSALLTALPGLWFYSQLPAPPVDPETLTALTIPRAGMQLIATLISLVIFGTIVLRMQNIATGDDRDLGTELRGSLKAFPWLFLGGILCVLAVMGGLLLLIIPGLILSVSLMFFGYAILCDGEGPVSGLKQSHRLVWGHWWRTAVVMTVALIVLMIAYLLVGLMLGFAAGFAAAGTPASVSIMSLLAQVITGAVATPLLYAVGLVQYRDLKLRGEGTDLEARIEDQGAHASVRA